MTPLPVMHPVTSTNIAAVGHQDGALFVRFKSGATYRYAGVPSHHLDALKSCESPGGYHRAQILGKFPHVKL